MRAFFLTFYVFFLAERVSAKVFSALILHGKFSSNANFLFFVLACFCFKVSFIHCDRSSFLTF